MADKLTEEEIYTLKNIFAVFDKEGDGAMDAGMLESALRGSGLNPTAEMVDSAVREFTQDGLNYIDFPEFLTIFVRIRSNKNGVVSVQKGVVSGGGLCSCFFRTVEEG